MAKFFRIDAWTPPDGPVSSLYVNIDLIHLWRDSGDAVDSVAYGLYDKPYSQDDPAEVPYLTVFVGDDKYHLMGRNRDRLLPILLDYSIAHVAYNHCTSMVVTQWERNDE